MTVEKVSIIIPVYNRTQDVKRLLHQLAQQSTTQFEVIVIDDCSHDPVEPALAREAYPFAWKCIRHEKNCGVGKARNTGISEATGEVLLFIDSDAEILSREWHQKYGGI